jgi:CDP-6-deoxy-D-xylo-4-hexulose-3-dehydrase
MNYNWPLNVNNFSLLDRAKIALFFLQENQWTQGNYVQKFEEEMSKFVESSYAVFVSSGSTANSLLAMYLKDKDFSKKEIVFPSTTWITSVAPFIREGFIPKFVDITLSDFCMDLDKLNEYLSVNANKVRCVFPTSLLGFSPNMNKLQGICEHYGVELMMDNCENTLGGFAGRNISSFTTSTTSTYFGHQIQSVEGGFVFTNSKEQYEYFLMARNHGMVRSLPLKAQYEYRNEDVDSRFDFHCLGSNFRNTNINAFIGLLDLKRAGEYKKRRVSLYSALERTLHRGKFIYPLLDCNHVPFCIPIVASKGSELQTKERAILHCDMAGIENRPIISGNLLRQTCFKRFGNKEDYPNSEHLHKCGFYVGLHPKLKEQQIIDLADFLNSL